MARKVVWAHAAIEDMEAIAEYIQRDSNAYAFSFIDRVLKTARTLSNFAERGRRVPEFENKNIREVFIQNYRMIYRIEDDHVFIVALIHGRRDLRTTLQ